MKIVKMVKLMYVALDGRNFFTKEACEEYENIIALRLKKDRLGKEVSQFLISEAEGDTPFDGCENLNRYKWHWYKVSDQSQVDALNRLYSLSIKITQFPEFICVKEDDLNCYETYLSNSIKYVKELCAKLGIRVKFEIEDIEDADVEFINQ